MWIWVTHGWNFFSFFCNFLFPYERSGDQKAGRPVPTTHNEKPISQLTHFYTVCLYTAQKGLASDTINILLMWVGNWLLY